MNIKRIFITYIAVSLSFALSAQLVIEWNQILNWVGTGGNRAAIGVQFNDGYAEKTYVWGYRWEGDELPTLRDVMSQIAMADRTLCILEQQTSLAGKFMLAAIGYDEAHTDCQDIYFDFDAALSDSKLNYNYYAEGGPGDNTPAIYVAAVADAKSDNVIRHPVNAVSYKWPAYDYDHWYMPNLSFQRHWNAGWNIGNWIVWKGEAGNDSYKYYGMGYSSVVVENDDVIVWNFNRHTCYPSENDHIDGYTGATRPLRPAEYTASSVSGISHTVRDKTPVAVIDIQGRICRPPLKPGIYIIISSDHKVKKSIIN